MDGKKGEHLETRCDRLQLLHERALYLLPACSKGFC